MNTALAIINEVVVGSNYEVGYTAPEWRDGSATKHADMAGELSTRSYDSDGMTFEVVRLALASGKMHGLITAAGE